MPYATRQDLIDRYGEDEIAQRESVLPEGAVDLALADAAAVVDGYVATIYTVPLAPVPDNIPRVVCQIARFGLLGSSNDEQSRADYASAIAWLKDVSAGRSLLPGVALAVGSATPGAPNHVSGGAVFDGGVGF